MKADVGAVWFGALTAIALWCGSGCVGKSVGTEGFALVTDGVPSAVVRMTGDKTVDADIAFFTNAVARMTGAELKVEKWTGGMVEKCSGGEVVFEIVKRPITDEDVYEIALPDEKTLEITGTDLSCRWALNALLEGQGVVFCMPGKHGTHYPQMRSLSVARKARRASASIRLERDLFAEDPDWQRSLNGKKQNGRFFWHNLNTIFPIAVYGKEPWCAKIMPEKNSQRVCPGSWEAGWQPCFAAPEGIAEAVRVITEHLRTHPSEKVYSLAVNDLEGYCECAACRKLNGGFETKSEYVKRFVNHSPSYYHWVNEVVRGVRKEFPKIVFGLLAYCGTIDPPPFRLEKGVVPYLCFDIQQLSDPTSRAVRERLLTEWAKKADSLGIWDYAFGLPGYAVPREYPDEQQMYFGYKQTICPSLDGFFTEGMISLLASEAKKRYLYYRLAWDSTRKADEESARWCQACVGKEAAPHLIAYYNLWKDFWHSEKVRATSWYREGSGSVYYAYSLIDYLFALNEAMRRRSAELMAAVVSAAENSGTPDQKKRAAYLKHVEDYLAARQTACCVGFTDSNGKFADAAAAARFLKALPEIDAADRSLDRVRAQIFADARENPSTRLEERLRKFGDYRNNNRTVLLNRAIAFRTTDKTVDVLFRKRFPQADDPASSNVVACTDEASETAAWQIQLRGVGATRVTSVDGSPRYALTTRDAKDGWQTAIKIVGGLKPNQDYITTARFTNPTKRTITCQLQEQTVAPDNYRPRDGGQYNSVAVPPGASRTVSVFTTAHFKPGAARICVVPHGLGADTVYVDNVRMVAVEEKD